MGALAVLQKPFTQETMLATIHGLLGTDERGGAGV
jgi:hypothetical protein